MDFLLVLAASTFLPAARWSRSITITIQVSNSNPSASTLPDLFGTNNLFCQMTIPPLKPQDIEQRSSLLRTRYRAVVVSSQEQPRFMLIGVCRRSNSSARPGKRLARNLVVDIIQEALDIFEYSEDQSAEERTDGRLKGNLDGLS
jgi:hypothetical protein